MTNPALELHKLEANLARLQGRMPDVPTSCVLLSRLLLHLGRGMSALFEHEIRPFGLSEAEFRVLTTLFSQPDGVAHPSELCSKTSQSPANMSRISDALVGRDLITRVPSQHDRRKTVLRITDQGEGVVRRLLPMMWGPLQHLFRDFSEEQRLALILQLKSVAVRMDESMHHQDPGRPA